MSELIDRHELRLELEKEEANCKRVLGKDHEPLVTAFFEIIYRALNKTPTVMVGDAIEHVDDPEVGLTFSITAGEIVRVDG